MTLAIIPERARKLLPTGDLQPIIQRLTADWQGLKDKWKGESRKWKVESGKLKVESQRVFGS